MGHDLPVRKCRTRGRSTPKKLPKSLHCKDFQPCARSCPLGYGLLLMKPQERLAMVPYLIGKAEKKQRPKRNRRPPTVGSAVTST
jgi:hypothetical protein